MSRSTAKHTYSLVNKCMDKLTLPFLLCDSRRAYLDQPILCDLVSDGFVFYPKSVMCLTFTQASVPHNDGHLF